VAPIALIYFQSVIPSITLDSIFSLALRNPTIETPAWWRWNMSGIENKDNSDDVMSLWSFLRLTDTKDFRVAVEYGDYNRFGSPRIFEMTYAVTGKPVLEGLLLESSVLYPSYFYASFFLVPTTWWPGFPVQVPPPDAKKGIEYFSKFHVGYYVASSADVKAKLSALNYKSMYKNDTFQVFEVNQDSGLVSVVQGEVPRVSSAKPLYESVLHYPTSLDYIVTVAKDKAGTGLAEFKEKPSQQLIPLKSEWAKDNQSLKVLDIPVEGDKKTKLFFKIPYFPNWKVQTGEVVQIVTPNMMMVETNRSQITLSYAPGWPEMLAGLVSLGSWVVFFWFAMLKLKNLLEDSFGRSLRTSNSRR
jgi:hypothetical protein